MLAGAGFVLVIIMGKSLIQDEKAKNGIKEIGTEIINSPTSIPTMTPTAIPTITPTVTPKITKTQSSGHKLSNKQFDATATNQSFGKINSLGRQLNAVNFNFSLRNISVTPFIVSYGIDECIVIRDGQLTKFKTSDVWDYKITPKAILPSETFDRFTSILIFSTEGYDSSGNQIKTEPSGNIRLQSCRVQVSTTDGYVVEPKTMLIY